jgi:hypothetical protein
LTKPPSIADRRLEVPFPKEKQQSCHTQAVTNNRYKSTFLALLPKRWTTRLPGATKRTREDPQAAWATIICHAKQLLSTPERGLTESENVTPAGH